jgi:hypothetical protein
MHWYDVNIMSMILFVCALVIGWLKGRQDFKNIPQDESEPSPCGPWED